MYLYLRRMHLIFLQIKHQMLYLVKQILFGCLQSLIITQPVFELSCFTKNRHTRWSLFGNYICQWWIMLFIYLKSCENIFRVKCLSLWEPREKGLIISCLNRVKINFIFNIVQWRLFIVKNIISMFLGYILCVTHNDTWTKKDLNDHKMSE